MDLTSESLLGALSALHPVARQTLAAGPRTGLVIVDVVNGFCTPGAGPLAPQEPDPKIDAMVAAIDALARRFAERGWPIYVVRDEHDHDRPEPPYPPHCLRGTGDEDLVPSLGWLASAPETEIHPKDCINLIVGSTGADGRVGFYDWIRNRGLETVIFTGICTDICLVDPVVTLLSARNHAVGGAECGPGPNLQRVAVYEPGCATYHLPPETRERLGLPEQANHDGPIAHHTGLWLMQARGALIADAIEMSHA